GSAPVRLRELLSRDQSQLADRCLELSSEGHRRLFADRQPRYKNGCPERHPDPQTLHEVRDPHVITPASKRDTPGHAGLTLRRCLRRYDTASLGALNGRALLSLRARFALCLV